MVARLDIQRARVVFAGKVRLKRFLDVLADTQRIQLLQVRVAFKENDCWIRRSAWFISSMDSARDLAAMRP